MRTTLKITFRGQGRKKQKIAKHKRIPDPKAFWFNWKNKANFFGNNPPAFSWLEEVDKNNPDF